MSESVRSLKERSAPGGESGSPSNGQNLEHDRTEPGLPPQPIEPPVPAEIGSTAPRIVEEERSPFAGLGSTARRVETADDEDAYVFGEASPVDDDAPTVIRKGQEPAASPVPDHDDATDHAAAEGLAGAGSRLGPIAAQYLVGETLGHFRLDEFVGGGGMGCVFRASDLTLGRTVAVKVLSARGRDSDLLARFRNEAQNAARLDHDNIARVYFVGADKGWNFIVFEFIEGINLRELVEREGPLPLDRAFDYVLQICDALEHASSRDVVHRDIKPSNVLITPQNRAKLVDMGLARLQHIETPAGDLTASGVTLGTFDYISPEQARDPRFADVRSDIYSLGCTLFYVVTGQPPFAEGSGLQKLLRHTSDHPPDPRAIRPELPERLTTILWKSLAKAPEDRYQSPSEFAGALAILADELGYSDTLRGRTLVVSAPAPSTPFARFAVWGVALATLLLSLFAANEFARSKAGSDSPPLRPVLAARADSAAVPLPTDDPRSDAATTPTTPSTTIAPPAETSIPRIPTLTPGAIAAPESPSVGSSNAETSSPIPTPRDATSATAVSAAAARTAFAFIARTRDHEKPLWDLPLGPQGDSSATWRRDKSVRVDVRRESKSDVSSAVSHTSGLAGSGSHSAHRTALASNVVVTESGETLRLVVGDQSEFAQPGDRFVADLAEAVRILERSPQIHGIELRYHGWRACPPIRLDKRRVSIVAGGGYRPGLAFPPPQAGSTAAAIDLRNSDVAFEDVELRWELPLDAGSDQALFETWGATTLRMVRSCVTLSNLSDLGAPAHEGVAFFRVGVDETLSEDAARPAPAFEFVDVVFRGEATLFRANDGAWFSCRWNDGLLATSERLVVAGGSAGSKTLWRDEMIDVSLNQVTAIVPQGLALFEAIGDAGEVFPSAKISVRNSIVKTRPAAPLLEHRGAVDVTEASSAMDEYGGRNGFYPETEILWQVTPIAGPIETFDIERIGSVDWFKVSAPRKLMEWNQLPQAPVSQQSPEDYRLLEDPSNPALWGSEESGPVGADWTRLPTPLAPPRRSTTAAVAPASVP